MYIEWHFGEDFGLEINEHAQFSLYDKDGKATHYQATNVQTNNSGMIGGGGGSSPSYTGGVTLTKKSVQAHRIQQLKVETPEEKVAKEAVKKAEESLKAAKDTLKAIKGIN